MSWMTETRIAVRLHRTRLFCGIILNLVNPAEEQAKLTQAVTDELCPGTKSMFTVDVAFITAIVSHPTRKVREWPT